MGPIYLGGPKYKKGHKACRDERGLTPAPHTFLLCVSRVCVPPPRSRRDVSRSDPDFDQRRDVQRLGGMHVRGGVETHFWPLVSSFVRLPRVYDTTVGAARATQMLLHTSLSLSHTHSLSHTLSLSLSLSLSK